MTITNAARQLLSPEWKRNKRPVQSPNYKTGFFKLNYGLDWYDESKQGNCSIL